MRIVDSRETLKECIEIEYVQTWGVVKLHDFLFPSVRAYILVLRNAEYFSNTKGMGHHLIGKFLSFWLGRYQIATGITIPQNTCGKGLTLYHHGSIVVNPAAIIGNNCCIMNNVNIGSNKGSEKAPIIGNNVYIGPGAVIFGDIFIADGCYIGANAVVNKDIVEPNSVVVGIPAKVIKKDPIHWWEYNNLVRRS